VRSVGPVSARTPSRRSGDGDRRPGQPAGAADQRLGGGQQRVVALD